MRKYKQGKRLITSLICLMFIALASFCCVVYFNNKEVVNKIPQAGEINYDNLTSEQIYDFSRGRIESTGDDRYKNYKYFSISNYEELLEFSITVAYGCSFGDGNVGNNKIVFLENDINSYDPGNRQYANWQPIGSSMDWSTFKGVSGGFRGTFDGRNCTISNLTCKVDNYKLGLQGYAALGFFSKLNPGAQILNLRLYNSKYEAGNIDQGIFGQSGGVVGGLAGELSTQGEYTIKNVAIDGLILKCGSLFWGSGLLCRYELTAGEGDGDIEITDCYIGDVSVEGIITNKMSYIGVVNTSFAEMGFKMKFVFDNVVVKEGSSYQLYYSDAETEIDNTIYVNADTEIFFEKDVALSKMNSEGNWFCPTGEEYNNGWPSLKSFIQIQEYRFMADNNGEVTVGNGVTSVYVPLKNRNGADIDCVTKFLDNPSATKTFFGVPIMAEGRSGYIFKNWTYNASTKTFLAKFELIPIKVTFNSITINNKGEECKIVPTFSKDEDKRVITLEQQLQVNFGLGANRSIYCNVVNSTAGYTIWQATYDMGSSLAKELVNIYTLEAININGKKVASLSYGQRKIISVEQIAAATGTNIDDLVKNGIVVDLSFKLKDYGLEVK